jgi:hypothetical protein
MPESRTELLVAEVSHCDRDKTKSRITDAEPSATVLCLFQRHMTVKKDEVNNQEDINPFIQVHVKI